MYKSVPFDKKWLQRPKTGVKHDFGEMEHKFLFGTFHQEIQDYLFDVSSLLEIFCWNGPKSNGFPQNFLQNIFFILSNTESESSNM